MKKGSMALAMAAAVFGACGCSAEEAETVKAEAEPGKILVAYYSYSGNTRFAAEQIQKATGGTLRTCVHGSLPCLPCTRCLLHDPVSQ